MADEITTKKVENLSENTEPADEDVFLFGSGGTNAIKKIKWSNILAKLRSLLFVDSCASTETGYGLTAKQGKLLQDQVNALSAKIGNLKLLGIQEVWMSAPSAEVNGQSTASANFNPVPGAEQYFAVLKQHGWLTPTTVEISGTTLSCTFLNTSSGAHSGNATFVVLALANA